MPRKCPCGKQPIYNAQGRTVGICCSTCKKPGMADVVHKKCFVWKTTEIQHPREDRRGLLFEM